MAGNFLEVKKEAHLWDDVLSLLATGQYESAAALLQETEAATDSDSDPAVKTILQATREMCRAGNDYRAEADFHRRAFHAASARDQQLRQQLQVLLGLIVSRRPSSEHASARARFPSNGLVESKLHIPGLLRRLQILLGHNSSPGPTGVEVRQLALATPQKQAIVEEEHGDPTLAVHCLGAFVVYHNDQPIMDWNGLKGLAILKYLVAHGGRPVPKDVLMEVLWPTADLEAARRNLHQAIYSLRQALRHYEPDFQHILFHHDAYHFNPRLALWIDYVEFERYVRLGQHQEAAGDLEAAMSRYGVAEELYEGDFMEEDPYEEWAIAQRERLRTTYLRVTDQLAAYYVQRQKYSAATAIAQKALRRDPYYEAAHRWLMRCFMAQGQRHLAVRQYQICADLLDEELDLEPSPETVALYEEMRGAG